jgi:hypothetical protein
MTDLSPDRSLDGKRFHFVFPSFVLVFAKLGTNKASQRYVK